MALYRTDKDKRIKKVAGNVGSGYVKADRNAANLSEADVYNWQRKLGIEDPEQLSEVISRRTKRFLIDSWALEDGSQWYNIYNDGWKECGGVAVTNGSSTIKTITLPIAFTNLNYTAKINAYGVSVNSQTIWTKMLEGYKDYQSFGVLGGYQSGSSGAYYAITFDYYCCGY